MIQQNVLKGETAVSFKHKPYKVLSSTSIAGKINESILFILKLVLNLCPRMGMEGRIMIKEGWKSSSVSRLRYRGINSGELDRKERY